MTAFAHPVPLSAAQRTRNARFTLPVALLAFSGILPRIGFLARPFDSDSGLYIYMGKALVEGQTLYRDFYETKPPGVALFTAGLYQIFGHHWMPYVLLQAAMTVLGAYVLGKAVARHLGERAFLPTLAFALVFLNFSPVAYRGFQLETVQCFFASLAGACALCAFQRANPRPVEGDDRTLPNGQVALALCALAGLFAGIGAMLKPTAAAVAGAFIVTLFFRRPRNFKPILCTIFGLSIAPLLVFLWTWRTGLLDEMPALFREIALYGSGTPIDWIDWLKPVIALLVAALPFIFVKISRTGATPDQCATPQRPLLFFAASWLVLEILGVILQRRMYIYHFLPLAPPLALLFAHACQNRRPHVYAVALVPIIILSVALSRGDFAMLVKSGIANLPESKYLLAHANPADTVVGDPIERLLMETHLRCGARYAHLFYFVNHDNAPREYAQRFIDDLNRNKPAWAVFATDRQSHHQMQCKTQPMLAENPGRRADFLSAWDQVDAYLAAHYDPVARAGEMTIYRRR